MLKHFRLGFIFVDELDDLEEDDDEPDEDDDEDDDESSWLSFKVEFI